MPSSRLSLVLRLVVAFYTALAIAAQQQEPLTQQQGYKVGERIPVSCLNRTMYVAADRRKGGHDYGSKD